MPTMAKNSGQRVVRINSLRMSCSVLNAISGRNSPKARSAVTPASVNALLSLPRSLEACALISHLLDVRPAEQALRQENQCDGEHGEGGDILVVDGEICRPHGLDQADQNTADH